MTDDPHRKYPQDLFYPLFFPSGSFTPTPILPLTVTEEVLYIYIYMCVCVCVFSSLSIFFSY
jgi:hypothetical protein